MSVALPIEDGLEPGRSRRRPWIIGATVIAVPMAFIGLLAIAPKLPEATPAAPSLVFAVPYGSGTAKVVWRSPASGGAVITAYRVTPHVGFFTLPTRVFPATATSAIFTGLQNGKAYRFVVTARNRVGLGEPSPQTAPVIVGAPGEAEPPTVVRVRSGELRVTFIAPGGNGAPVTALTVTCFSTNGGALGTASASASPITVTHLTSGKSYACAVKATNGRGTGPGSRTSELVDA